MFILIKILLLAIIFPRLGLSQTQTSSPIPINKQSTEDLPEKIHGSENQGLLKSSQNDMFTKRAAQEANREKQLIKDESFQGVIQFVHGDVAWLNSSRKAAPQFKTILKKADVLKIGSYSYVKIITQKRCIAVIYGPALLKAPVNKEDEVWQIDEASLRWICPGKSEEKIQIAGKPLTLFAAEIFYHQSKLLVISGEPQGENGNLNSKQLYVSQQSHFIPVQDPPHIHSLWMLNQQKPLPKESTPWPEPEKPKKYRFQFGPHLGWSQFMYEHFQIREAFPNHVMGGQIVAYFHRDKKVYFISLNDSDRSSGPQPSNMSGLNLSGSLSMRTLCAGIRFKSENKWSYIARVGIGESRMQIHYNPSYDHEVEHTVLQAGFGADYMMQFEGWKFIGLIFSAEMQFTTNIGHARLVSPRDNTAPLLPAIENNGLSSAEILIHAGPLFYF